LGDIRQHDGQPLVMPPTHQAFLRLQSSCISSHS
jgi:hypothetical protein